MIVAHNFIRVFEICDRVDLLRHGSITFDKVVAETSAVELTDLAAAECRASNTARAAASS